MLRDVANEARGALLVAPVGRCRQLGMQRSAVNSRLPGEAVRDVVDAVGGASLNWRLVAGRMPYRAGSLVSLVGHRLDRLQFTGVQLFFAGLQYDRWPGHCALPSRKTYRAYMRLIGIGVIAKWPHDKPRVLELSHAANL